MHFKKDIVYHKWTGKSLGSMDCSVIHVFKDISKSRDVLFVIDRVDRTLKVIWSDGEQNQQWTDSSKVGNIAWNIASLQHFWINIDLFVGM